jgi:hypothetical protein
MSEKYDDGCEDLDRHVKKKMQMWNSYFWWKIIVGIIYMSQIIKWKWR